MKSQRHNQGEVKTLKVDIEKDVYDSLEEMAKNSGLDIPSMVVIAIKRFRSSHSDYEDTVPHFED